jgi:hypothetical protein
VLIRHLPRTSRTLRELEPANAWDDGEYLLAAILDALHGANWQRSGDQKAARPKPTPRPGDEPEPTLGTAVPLTELRRRLHPEEFEEVTDGG